MIFLICIDRKSHYSNNILNWKVIFPGYKVRRIYCLSNKKSKENNNGVP